MITSSDTRRKLKARSVPRSQDSHVIVEELGRLLLNVIIEFMAYLYGVHREVGPNAYIDREFGEVWKQAPLSPFPLM